MPAIRLWLSVVLAFGLLAGVSMAGDAAGSPAPRLAKGPLTFEEHVRPILKAHCFRCHGGEDEPKAGLDLRLRRLAADGGDSGPAIAPGKRGESLLFARISRGEMPPTDLKLSAADVELIGEWIDGGAKTLGPEPDKVEPGLEITPQERSFWSFRRVPAEVSVPRPATAERVRTPIDAFLLRELEKQGLTFSSEAAKAALYARAHFDLLGLPPGARSWRPSWPTRIRWLTSGRSTAFSTRPATVNGGGATGSTWPAMPTPTATRRQTRRGRSPTSIATT